MTAVMRPRGKSPSDAEHEFLERASLFPERLPVKLVIYADESGTHDQTGALKGAREAVIGGIVAPGEDWRSFCSRWQAALNKYGAPYFHFCEWSDACSVAREKRKPTSTFKNNPYRNWKHETLNRFLIELATLAGS